MIADNEQPYVSLEFIENDNGDVELLHEFHPVPVFQDGKIMSKLPKCHIEAIRFIEMWNAKTTQSADSPGTILSTNFMGLGDAAEENDTE